MRKLIAALACRAGGSRLYGKPLQLLDIERKWTVLDYMIRMLKTESAIQEIVLGVSEGQENEPFHAIARTHGIHSIRGDETDVLGRLIRCGETSNATDIFRVTTESPFTFFDAIADAWEAHHAHENDLTAVDGLPEGCSFEIYTLDALRRSHESGDGRHRSEFCSLYIREHRNDFHVEIIEPPAGLDRLDLRLTIDYPEDLVLCRRVFETFRELAPRIPLARIIPFLDDHPELTSLVKPYVVPARLYS